MTVRLAGAAAAIGVALLAGATPGSAQTARQGAERNYDAVKSMMLSMPQESVRHAQQVLADEGYYRGLIDGRLDPSTERAIESFQRAHGMPPDGKLNTATLAALRREEGAASP